MGKARITRRGIGSLFVNVMVAGISLVCIFPIIWVIYSSLKTDAEFFRNTIMFPTVFHFENFVEAFTRASFDSYLINSAVNSIVCVTAICLCSFFIGFFIARMKTKLMRFIYYLLLAGMLIPVHGLLVPTFIMFKNLDILDKVYTLWIPYIAFGLPIAVFLVEGFVRDIPVEIEEAAYLDGCNIHQLIFKIRYTNMQTSFRNDNYIKFFNRMERISICFSAFIYGYF